MGSINFWRQVKNVYFNDENGFEQCFVGLYYRNTLTSSQQTNKFHISVSFFVSFIKVFELPECFIFYDSRELVVTKLVCKISILFIDRLQ